MNVEWVRIVSWHAIRTWTRVPGRALTLCGRTANVASSPTSGVSATLPAERSCETCLRIVARQADK